MRRVEHVRWSTLGCGGTLFGRPFFLVPDGRARFESVHGVRFLFTGREYLAPVGLCDYRHRAYSPTLGRFLQVDHARRGEDSCDWMKFSENTPSLYIDPLGLQAWPHEEARSPNLDKHLSAVRNLGRQNLLLPVTPPATFYEAYPGLLVQMGDALSYVQRGLLSSPEAALYGLGLYPSAVPELREWARRSEVRLAFAKLAMVDAHGKRIAQILKDAKLDGYRGRVTIEIEIESGRIRMWKGDVPPQLGPSKGPAVVYLDFEI